MLARQETFLGPVPSKLTLLFRYSCELFVALAKLKSFVVKQIRTLCAKHPGWGHLLLRTSPGLCHRPSIFKFSVFMTLQTPFPGTLLFSHLYKSPGVWTELAALCLPGKSIPMIPWRIIASQNVDAPCSTKAVYDRQNVCDRHGVVLGFALQQAARAAQVLGRSRPFAPVSASNAPLEESSISRKAYLLERFCTGRAPRCERRGTKGKTIP